MIETVKSIYNKLPYIVLCLKGDIEIKLISRALKSNYEEIIVTGSHKMELMEAKDLFSALGKYGLNENIEKKIRFIQVWRKKTLYEQKKERGRKIILKQIERAFEI